MQEYLLSSAGLRNGVYIIRLQTGDEVVSRKVQVFH